MKKHFIIALFMLCALGIGCGVKKNPDIYYSHPFDFNEGFRSGPGPSPSSTPAESHS